MDFIDISLCKDLNEYESIVVYGTGKFAQEIYPHLLEHGLREKILCFTQTEENEINQLDGIPVISIKKLNCKKNSCVILVAVSKLYENEIKKILKKYNYTYMIFLTDYIINDGHNEEVFSKFTNFEKYCEAIAMWYLKTHKEYLDKDVIMQRLLKRGNSGDKDENLIVMICGHISVRSNKIMNALINKGYRLVILDHCLLKHSWCIQSYERVQALVYRCECLEELLYHALQFNPLVFFFEPRWADCSWAQIMIRQKHFFGKVVLSLYDVANDGLFIQQQTRLDTEKYALENADGVVWRWFSKDYLKKKGFCYKGKSIQFLDYCSYKDTALSYSEISSNVLKLCFVVGWDAFFVTKRDYHSKYKSFARLDDILAKLGNRQDCIFHFYVGRLSDEWIEICKQYKEKYHNFDFYLNTERDELLKKLQRYDYGCNLCTEGEWPLDDMPVDNATGSYMKNSVRNTIFDYLSAGLPIIGTVPLKLIEYLQQYHVVITMDISNIDLEYLKENKNLYKRNVKAAAEQLDIKNQIHRLIDFFKEL